MDQLADILKEVTHAFSDLGIDYMIVGSTAMWAYVPGRTTFDTDVLVRMTPKQLVELAARFGEAWYLDRGTAHKQLVERRMFNAIHYATSWKLDLIPLKEEPFHQSEFGRRRHEKLPGLECFVQSPEDLVLSKLQWAQQGGSKRQLEDVKALLRGATNLDEAYLDKWARSASKPHWTRFSMDDTPLDIYFVQVRSWRAKPFSERMRLGFGASAFALRAAASLVAHDDPAALFLSLHGDSFSAADRARIAEAFRKWHSARA